MSLNSKITLPTSNRMLPKIARPRSIIRTKMQCCINNNNTSLPSQWNATASVSESASAVAAATANLKSTVYNRGKKIASDNMIETNKFTNISSSIKTTTTTQQQSKSSSSLYWEVNNTSLKHVPYFFPPLDPRCTIYIKNENKSSDALSSSPSAIAARIAECLHKLNLSVEFDNQATTATAMTIDGCYFHINMFKGGSSSSFKSATKKTYYDFDTIDNNAEYKRSNGNADVLENVLSQSGVIVECIRIRGSVISFHHCCRSILSAAAAVTAKTYSQCKATENKDTLLNKTIMNHQKILQSTQHDDNDLKKNQNTNSEIDILQVQPNNISPTNSNDNIIVINNNNKVPSSSSKIILSKTLESLEYIVSLLQKDRLEPQQTGMEALVDLTNPKISGKEVAKYASFVVLGISPNNNIFTPPTAKGETDNKNKEEYESNDKNDYEFLQYSYTNRIIDLIQNLALPDNENNKKTSSNNKYHNIGDVYNNHDIDSSSCSEVKTTIAALKKIGNTSMKFKTYNKDEYYYHNEALRSLSLRALTNTLENVSKQSNAKGESNNGLSFNGMVNKKKEPKPPSFLLDNVPLLLCNKNKSIKFVSLLIDDIADNDANNYHSSVVG